MSTGATSKGMVLLDPVGYVPEEAAKKLTTRLSDLTNKKVGFVFDGHYMAEHFWPAMEEDLVKRLHLAGKVSRIKPNVGAPAPQAMVDEVASQVDIAVTGMAA
ncbi:MAG: hypothetical protein Q7T26_05885 [Dehalococcoidia bacterium]|nr:hypothetical protein [Dehalococcoidia bacterium]